MIVVILPPKVLAMTEQITSHPAVTRVRERLTHLGVDTEITVLPGAARTAALAAEALGVEVSAIANSLVFAAQRTSEDEPHALLVLTSGGHRVDTDFLAHQLGYAQIGRADADFVRAHTGFAIGGVAPVGHPEQLDTVVDAALAEFDAVWAAAGHPHTVFPTTYRQLLEITGGRTSPVCP